MMFLFADMLVPWRLCECPSFMTHELLKWSRGPRSPGSTISSSRFPNSQSTEIPGKKCDHNFSKKLMPKPPFVFNGSLLTECWKVRPVFCRHPFKGSRMLSSFFSDEWSWPGDPGTAPILLLVWPAMVPVWEASMAILNHPKITGRDVCLTYWLKQTKICKISTNPIRMNLVESRAKSLWSL